MNIVNCALLCSFVLGMPNRPDVKRLKVADRNPYSWNTYPDGSGHEARFTACGICTLMRELELYILIPAMCRLDYTMSEAGGASDFVREYTLASGGPYCDCGYKKRRSMYIGCTSIGERIQTLRRARRISRAELSEAANLI